ncbi:MAG TPA: energy-coupling factor transporter transmembrane component T [Acidimicrobiales bacterium]|nr:energy-coupling factor transporter transmembrane component T [Acidimicrobiales bacterium]
MEPGHRRRALHPAAWWAWAAGLATAAIETTNPVLLSLIAAVVVYVVATKRSAAPWSRSLVVFLRLGLIVIAIRVVVQVLFGDRIAGHVMFSLPQVSLPSWAAGVSIGGPVTAEAVLQALCEGLRLAVVLVAFGAANSLASPYRLLRCLPAVLYEAGVAVTVALTYAPELVTTIGQVREARRLRGRPIRGLAGLRGMAVPVLEGALDRSLELASSMDSRGYGRRTNATGSRRWATLATVAGTVLVLVGVYDVLGSATPWGLGAAALLVGAGALGSGVALSGRRAQRTRYRPDRWGGAEWLIALSGAAVVTAFSIAGALGVDGLQVSFYPLGIPPVPLLPCLGILLGLAPVLVSPTSAPRRGDADLSAARPRDVATRESR